MMRVADTHVAVTERPRWEWILAGAEQGGPDVLFFGKEGEFDAMTRPTTSCRSLP